MNVLAVVFIKEEKLQDIRSSIQKVAELALDDNLNLTMQLILTLI